MHAEDFLSGYAAKLLEYGLAVVYLILFVLFWRYVQGGRKVAQAVAGAMTHATPALATGWFTIPDDVALHPGHTWARMEADGTVAVGLDDLGHRLVGPVDRIVLPATGQAVEQGANVAALDAAGKRVGLLSPVEGEVVATNEAAAAGAHAEPYGHGWLFKVRPTRWARDAAQLLRGDAARAWVDDQARLLSSRLSPEPVPVLQDGGAPVHGIARELDPENWDAVAREFFRTQV